ncbi:YrhK family protein [Modicisalibacter radicis]|uniref:YrhK family protein n=1 Tax=Halomonas sp. EAR18 TaxID=2518972 RepID=UPI00109C6F34|nr:YrhK family protein [Halomonas sp. EAR18]
MRKERRTGSSDWIFTVGHEELVIHQRYEVLSIVNDFMLGLWFTLGSVCFFFEGGIKTLGIWLFVIGSAQLLVRPVIRLHRYVRFRHLPDTDHDA